MAVQSQCEPSKGDRFVCRALPVGDNGFQYFQELADTFAKQKLVYNSQDSHMFSFYVYISVCIQLSRGAMGWSVITWHVLVTLFSDSIVHICCHNSVYFLRL